MQRPGRAHLHVVLTFSRLHSTEPITVGLNLTVEKFAKCMNSDEPGSAPQAHSTTNVQSGKIKEGYFQAQMNPVIPILGPSSTTLLSMLTKKKN